MRISDWSSDVCSADLLDHALFAQVVQRLAKLLRLGGVFQRHAPQDFRREVRQAGEAHPGLLAQRVPDPQRAMVGNADDVARKGLVRDLAVLREKEDRGMPRERLAAAQSEERR